MDFYFLKNREEILGFFAAIVRAPAEPPLIACMALTSASSLISSDVGVVSRMAQYL